MGFLIPPSTRRDILFLFVKGEWITGVAIVVTIAEAGEGVIGVAGGRFFIGCAGRGGFFGLLFVEGEAGGELTASSGRGDVEGCWGWWDEGDG